MSDRPLTVADLEAANACARETALFKELWGEGGEMTYEKVMASALQFDWHFAARHLLTDKQEGYFKTQIMLAFRHIPHGSDPRQEKRRRAMALAFYKAWNSPQE